MNQAVQCYRVEQQRRPPADREAIVTTYMPLVRKVASRIARSLPPQVDLEDLILSGCVGLLTAIDRFDPVRGEDFGAFAEYRIKGAILDDLRTLDPVPRRSRRRMHQLDATRHKLTGELGRPPSDAEMAARLGLTADEYLSLSAATTPSIDLSLTLLEEWGRELSDHDHGDACPPDGPMQRREMRQALVQSLASLPDKLRTVISLYYYAKLSYKEIAVLFDVCESRICQMHRDAISAMRAHLEGSRSKTRRRRRRSVR